MRKLKRTLSVFLVLCMVLSMVATTSFAATDYEIALPEEAMDTEGSTVLTTLAQRASSEIPLIFGLNAIGGNMFSGLQDVGGTSVNENPDPYVWNYNYLRNVMGLDDGGGVMSSLTAAQLAAQEYLPEGTYYVPLGNTLTNSNGLYSSGGANQGYGVAYDELGGVGYAVGYRTDVIIGFNSNIVDQIQLVNSWTEDDEYYQEGDEDYSPLIIDVQTGSVTSCLYAWTEMGQAISAYLDEHEDLTTRYEDPYAIAVDVVEFSAGIPYYIASLIADGTIEKKTAAYVQSISDNILTCVDPADVGNVGADVYAEVHNFNFLEGTYTVSTLMEAGVDVIILGTNGYSYNGSGSTQGGTSGTGKSDVLLELADLGYTADEVPLVMDSNTISVQIGTNGYNYSPITPMFVPYVQVYAYMEELEEVTDGLINPAAKVEFMFNELCHVSDEESRNVALYYIGTNWDAVDDEYDTVPDIENYVYDEDAIIEAINVGIQYALSGEAEENGNTLLAAYRTGENAYVILTQYLETEMDLENYTSSDYISLADTGDALGGGVGTIYYLNTTALYNAATPDTGSDMGSNESGGTSQFEDVDTSFAQIITYYNSGEYGYGDDLQATLQNYLSHMVEHVWDPSELLSVEGTYGYESSSGGSTGDDSSSGGSTDGDNTGSDHEHEYTSKVTLAATRYTEGVMTYTCTCGDSYTVAIPVLTDATFLFADLTSVIEDVNDWYYEAVYWIYDLGITVGYESGDSYIFQPNKSCTRAEFAQFIYTLAEAYGLDDMTVDGTENPFSDVAETDADGEEMWYYPAKMWAYENNIVVGYEDGTFQPNEAVTRAESIQMLYTFFVNFVNDGVEPEVDAENTFSDVANVLYYDTIMWGDDSGLVAGYTDGTCRPNIDCNRAVMAGLLYCTGTEILNPLYGVSTETE